MLTQTSPNLDPNCLALTIAEAAQPASKPISIHKLSEEEEEGRWSRIVRETMG